MPPPVGLSSNGRWANSAASRSSRKPGRAGSAAARRQPLFAPDHMRYLHQVIVDDIGQMIRRKRVGRLVEHFVVQRRRVDRHVAPDQVVHMHLLVFGHHEAYDPRFAGFHSPAHFLGRQRERRGQPAPYLVVIGERLSPRFGLGPDRGELLLRVERIVGVTRFDELLCVFQIDFATLALPIRGVRSSFGRLPRRCVSRTRRASRGYISPLPARTAANRCLRCGG